LKVNTALNDIKSVVMKTVHISPTIIRPSRKLESCGKTNEDDISIKYNEIVQRNMNLQTF